MLRHDGVLLGKIEERRLALFGELGKQGTEASASQVIGPYLRSGRSSHYPSIFVTQSRDRLDLMIRGHDLVVEDAQPYMLLAQPFGHCSLQQT